MTRVLIVDEDKFLRAAVAMTLSGEFVVVGECGRGEEALELAAALEPDVVLMDVAPGGMSGLEATRKLTQRHPLVATVLTSGDEDIGLMREAMAAGARDYLTKPFDTPRLLEVLRRLGAQARSRRRLLARDGRPPAAGIWAFTGPCGGSGQTTLLLAMAHELLAAGRRVLVVDLDGTFGNLAFYLGVTPGGLHLANLAREDFRDEAVLEEYLHRHPSGLRALVGPGEVLEAHGVRAEWVVPVVLAMEDRFDYVLVDLPSGLPDGYVEVLDAARYLFVPTLGNLGSLKKLRQFLAVLTRLEYRPETIRPVLVGDDPESPLVGDFNKILARVSSALAEVFPYDRAACEAAAYAGDPVTRHRPESEYAAAVRRYMTPLFGGAEPVPRRLGRRSLLARIFGG